MEKVQRKLCSLYNQIWSWREGFTCLVFMKEESSLVILRILLSPFTWLIKTNHNDRLNWIELNSYKISICFLLYTLSYTLIMFLPREIVSTLRCLSIRQLPLTSHLPILRLYSTETARKPLQFYISPSFHAKPPTASSPTNFQKKSTNNKVMQGFGKDSPIAKFRDLALKGNSQGIGHDFYFIKESNREGDFTIGIADGVGGWEDSGVDPSHFSQALMVSLLTFRLLMFILIFWILNSIGCIFIVLFKFSCFRTRIKRFYTFKYNGKRFWRSFKWERCHCR